MPIISTIGRKSFKVRTLIWSMYTVLIVGAVTMIYPFLLMLAGTTKSGVDTPEARIIPDFLVDTEALYKKYIEAFFNESLEAMKVSYDSETPSFRKVELPFNPNSKLVAEWEEFLREKKTSLNSYALSSTSCQVSRKTLPVNLRAFKAEIIKKYDGNLALMNKEMETEFVSWNDFYVLPEDFLLRQNNPGTAPIDNAFREFKSRQPLSMRYYFSPEGFYKNSFLKSQYTKDIAAYNKTHNSSYTSWAEVNLTRRFPADKCYSDQERDDWESFVRTILNLLWIRADSEAKPVYQEFLKAKYYNDISSLNKNYGTQYKSFSEIPILKEPPTGGLILSDWDAFLEGWKDPETGIIHKLSIDRIFIHSIDFEFRDFLKDKYGSIEDLNRAVNTSFSDWLDILPPQRDMHYFAFKKNIAGIRWEFVKRNYLSVVDYVVLHGRGILNTVIYCALAVICALLINPLAAYGLSRYKPPSAYKVLLFLMLTMAFPPMVTEIPVFLMLREFNLLNTFAALILPGMANGYSIFLLKGFFDSLPQELYESAVIDGAGEFRIFWQITMSLSKPILAVISLNAFTLAYSNFMMALLICQDQKMWTLMPWLYQLQQYSCQGVTFTSLIIASIPTFIIFALCQNIIMRGIVVPSEK